MPASPPSNQSTGRAVAQAGNAVALFAICLLLANTPLLFRSQAPTKVDIPPPKAVQRVVFIVVDGLRADAVNPRDMPRVSSLAGQGSLKTSLVGALVPSTVAGLRALIEGVVVPPAEFVHDFRSRRAPHGGLVEAVHASGGRVYTAGPRLWTDLYGEWIDGNLSVFGLARDDPAVFRAARAACADPQWKLVVVQFCRSDVAAHLHGGGSREYAASIQWCDQAIGDLAQAAGSNTLVVVTSDHGVTRAGGHAGTENAVVRTPLVASHPSFAPGRNEVPQTSVPHLISAALGVILPQAGPHQGSSPPPYLVVGICVTAALLGAVSVIRLLGSATTGLPPESAAFWLNGAVWTCLAAGWLNPWATCALALGVLFAAASRYSDGTQPTLAFVSGAGIAVGVVRLIGPCVTNGTSLLAQPSVFTLGAVCLLSSMLGYIGGVITRQGATKECIWLGFGIAASAPGLTALLGESVSLSTLDVRLAFRMIDTPFGLLGAVLLAALLPFLPLLMMTTGLVLSWWQVEGSRLKFAPIAAGAGAAIAGELALAAVTLSSSGSQRLSSLAFGLLIRESAHVTVLFPAMAMAAFFLQRRETGVRS